MKRLKTRMFVKSHFSLRLREPAFLEFWWLAVSV